MNPLSSSWSSGARASIAASQLGRAERRPPQSMTRSARSSSPSSVRTPVTCGVPLIASGPQRSPATATPRRTVRFGTPPATDATARSMTARRPETASKRSSPSLTPPVTKSGASFTGLNRSAPSRSIAAISWGSSCSTTWRYRARKRCGSRNWLTPVRSQLSHASAGVSGGPAASRSSTVTACWSVASSIPRPMPITLPPTTMTSAIALLLPSPLRPAECTSGARPARSEFDTAPVDRSLVSPRSRRARPRRPGRPRRVRPHVPGAAKPALGPASRSCPCGLCSCQPTPPPLTSHGVGTASTGGAFRCPAHGS